MKELSTALYSLCVYPEWNNEYRYFIDSNLHWIYRENDLQVDRFEIYPFGSSEPFGDYDLRKLKYYHEQGLKALRAKIIDLYRRSRLRSTNSPLEFELLQQMEPTSRFVIFELTEENSTLSLNRVRQVLRLPDGDMELPDYQSARALPFVVGRI